MSEVPAVHVRPMTQEEFDDWQGTTLEQYALDVAEARGIAVEDARPLAEASHRQYLPEGLATKGVHIVVGQDDDGEKVGILWLGPNPNGVGPMWIYEIEVIDERRGQGWGRALMGEAERIARQDGYAEIGLNVFGSNAIARGLYESLGYITGSIQMRKAL